MKLFILSDIHGSFYFLRKALDGFEREGADCIVLLGDVLYHGARNPLPEGYDPRASAALLNTFADKIIAVRGNCDSEVDQMVLDFPMMSDYSVVLYGERRLFLSHGHIFGRDNLPRLGPGDVFLYGHTHVPGTETRGDIRLINPGSISLPKENNPHSYGILDGCTFKIMDLNGDTVEEINLQRA